MSSELANAAARDAFEDEGWKRAPEMVADLHATSMPSDPKGITRFAAELLRLIPGMTGLDAVRIAKQEFERRHYLDPVDADALTSKKLPPDLAANEARKPEIQSDKSRTKSATSISIAPLTDSAMRCASAAGSSRFHASKDFPGNSLTKTRLPPTCRYF